MIHLNDLSSGKGWNLPVKNDDKQHKLSEKLLKFKGFWPESGFSGAGMTNSGLFGQPSGLGFTFGSKKFNPVPPTPTYGTFGSTQPPSLFGHSNNPIPAAAGTFGAGSGIFGATTASGWAAPITKKPDVGIFGGQPPTSPPNEKPVGSIFGGQMDDTMPNQNPSGSLFGIQTAAIQEN